MSVFNKFYVKKFIFTHFLGAQEPLRMIIYNYDGLGR